MDYRNSNLAARAVRMMVCAGLLSPFASATSIAQQPATPPRIVIEALVDGGSDFRVSKAGVYWVNGPNAKPGLHNGRNEPTFVDGKAWKPVWDDGGKPRGKGKSDTHPLALDPAKLQFQLLAIGGARGEQGIQKRTSPVVKMVGDELSIVIPDPERDSRWYTFALVSHAGPAPFPLVLAPAGGSVVASVPSVAPAPKSIDPGEFVKANRGNFVFIKGAGGTGSGFIARTRETNYLITSAHVAAASRGAGFKTMDGSQIQARTPTIAINHDICRAPITFEGKALETLEPGATGVAVGDEVMVLGDAEGAGVIKTIKGRIRRLDANTLEVDARFEAGNSGSPIVHLKTGKVIAVAAIETQRKFENTGKDPVKPPVIRHIGYRLDTATIWQPGKWDALFAQASDMAAVEKQTDDLSNILQELSKSGRIAPGGAATGATIKNRIETWLQSRSKRLSPQDAALAEQVLLSFIKNTSLADINAVRPRLTSDVFQRELDEQQKQRTTIIDIFERVIHAL